MPNVMWELTKLCTFSELSDDSSPARYVLYRASAFNRYWAVLRLTASLLFASFSPAKEKKLFNIL